MSISKLLPTHAQYHNNPIEFKTKNFTFWYTICNKVVFPSISDLKYTRAPKSYAIPDNYSIITTWGKPANLCTIKGYIKYIDSNPVYHIYYGSDFRFEVTSNHSSSDAATKALKVSTINNKCTY